MYDDTEKLKPELIQNFKELKSIVVSADPSIAQGGCILETPGGNIDATIETQLEKIRQCLTDTFKKYFYA